MVREEIGVDRQPQEIDRPQRRMVREAEIEQPPGARDIAANRGIHEAGKQRHAGDVENTRLRIDPGADAGLEHFHDGADHVINENDLGLVEGLELERQHGGLDGERHQEHEIVARQKRAARVPQRRADDQRNHGAAEQTGPGLLHAEADELVDERGYRTLRRPAAEPGLTINEPRQRRPLGRGAGGLADGFGIVQAAGPGGGAGLRPAW